MCIKKNWIKKNSSQFNGILKRAFIIYKCVLVVVLVIYRLFLDTILENDEKKLHFWSFVFHIFSFLWNIYLEWGESVGQPTGLFSYLSILKVKTPLGNKFISYSPQSVVEHQYFPSFQKEKHIFNICLKTLSLWQLV